MVRLGLAGALALAGSCTEDTPTVPQPFAMTVVAPSPLLLLDALGDTVRLTAEVRDQAGVAMRYASVEWSSSDERVATVDSTGLVTAVGNGTATVTAASGAVAGSAAVTVVQVVAEVRVEPGSVTLFSAGDTVRLAAQVVDANGRIVNGAGIEWSSDNAAVRVDGSGLVTAVNEGRAVVSAVAGGASASATIGVTFQTGPAKDRAILNAFFEATGGPRWSNRTNWLTAVPLDDWHGVRADGEGRVVALSLVGNNLEGVIPAELGRLDRLIELNLNGGWAYGARCSSPPPPNSAGVGRSGSATGAGTHYPAWTVTHSDWHPPANADIATDVSARAPPGWSVHASGGGNRLRGRIPAELGGLTNLEMLGLGLNELSGPLPPELGRLVNLKVLWLPGNRLTGPLPPELGNLIRLERLVLTVSTGSDIPPSSRYFLSGSLPPELGKLSNLRELNLFGHRFTGGIPPEFGNLTRLRHLSLACNRVGGPLPSELRQLRDLRHLDLLGARLRGRFPAWLGELSHLTFIGFSGNSLAGPIPPRLGELAQLEKAYLYGIGLSGPIPPEVGGMSSLALLSLGRNELTGPLPRELRNLPGLRVMELQENRLSGRVPPELGHMSRLTNLLLGGNQHLNGSLPLELMAIPLRDFDWSGTGLCSPRDREFQDWLADIARHAGEESCKLLPRKTLAAFFDATGGAGWAVNTNWMTDAPLSSWHGITVEDSLVVALELPDNGLEGALPPAIGDFTDLERLDVSGNRLSGGLPDDLVALDSLAALDLSDNQFEGALPGRLADVGALRELDWANSGVCAPEAGWFQSWLGRLSHRSGPDCGGPFALEFATGAVTQAANSTDDPIPLIAGRAAVVPVFAAADRANQLRPIVRLTIHSGAGSAHVEEAVLGSHRGIPTTLGAPRLDLSTPVVIPEGELAPGTELVVEMDPDATVPRPPGIPLRYPREGRLELDVREMPPMELTIVPVLVEPSRDSSVLSWVRDAGAAPVEFMRAVLPVGELAVAVREPLVVTGEPEGGTAWENLLQDIDLLRTTEDDTGYWYGVVAKEEPTGIVGIAYIGGRGTSVGIPDAEVFAHEIGHNMGLRHAPCGGPAGVDPDYPYGDGSIGVWGWDSRTGEFRPPQTPELMSYCGGGFRQGPPQWISDYHFGKAMEYRLSAEASASSSTTTVAGARGPRLLLRGGVSLEGELRLDPAFVLDAPARTPGGGGPYRVSGRAHDGRELFALDFDMTRDSQGGGGFLFLLPFEVDRLASLSRIELTGPEGAVALDGRTPVDPVAMVIDRATGRIRSILRGEAAERAAAVTATARSARGAAAVGATITLVSTGVPELPR